MGCLLPCSLDAIQHTQPHLQPATVTCCSGDVLNNPGIPELWLIQFWTCVLKFCGMRQMGSKINSNANDRTSYGDTWWQTLHEPPEVLRTSSWKSRCFPWQHSYFHIWLTIRVPSMATNMDTLAIVITIGWGGELGFYAKKDKAAIQLHTGSVVIQLKGAHS